MWAPSTRFWIERWCPRPSAGPLLAALLAAALAAPGCVTRSAHERAVDDLRSQLAEAESAARDRERSIEALESERGKLLGEIEDLRDARASLSEDVADREQ